MRKLFQNIISIILLVFYLTGFCGLNLLKHNCFACHEQDYHLIYDLENSGDEMHVCEVDSHPHLIQIHKNSTHAHIAEAPCCSLELIYLKSYPKTLVKQAMKSPLVSSLDLHLAPSLQLHNLSDLSKDIVCDYLQKIVDPPELTPQRLCCYRC
ncbi:hypothetical protein L3073_06950 [Ancylomarina sp. DW003]|nr:hypothetical protein [Ancylomarina sp. DW003]MDE5421941.1 hypothetical protein [Ancylomarina sp. DW003]